MNKVGGWSRRDSLGRASLSSQNDQGHCNAKWDQLCFIRTAASLPKSRPVTFPAPVSKIHFYIQAQFFEPRFIRKSHRRSHPRLVKAMGLRDDCDLHTMFWRYVSESYWNTQKCVLVKIQLEECGLVWHALTKSSQVVTMWSLWPSVRLRGPNFAQTSVLPKPHEECRCMCSSSSNFGGFPTVSGH